MVPHNYNFIFTYMEKCGNIAQAKEIWLYAHVDHVSCSMEYTCVKLFIVHHACNSHAIHTCRYTCITMIPLLYACLSSIKSQKFIIMYKERVSNACMPCTNTLHKVTMQISHHKNGEVGYVHPT